MAWESADPLQLGYERCRLRGQTKLRCKECGWHDKWIRRWGVIMLVIWLSARKLASFILLKYCTMIIMGYWHEHADTGMPWHIDTRQIMKIDTKQWWRNERYCVWRDSFTIEVALLPSRGGPTCTLGGKHPPLIFYKTSLSLYGVSGFLGNISMLITVNLFMYWIFFYLYYQMKLILISANSLCRWWSRDYEWWWSRE